MNKYDRVGAIMRAGAAYYRLRGEDMAVLVKKRKTKLAALFPAALTLAVLAFPSLAANGADGIPLWQSYVLGLDPEDATSLPQVSITMVDGIVELRLVGVEVNAMSGATVTYTVYKFANLADKAAAQPVGGEHAAGETAEVQRDASDDSMFYRIVVDVRGY